MAATSSISAIISTSLLFCLLSSESGFIQGGAALGINYGQVANNLPSPDQVLSLLTSLRISKARIYDTNPQVLTALANSGISLIVTVPDDQISTVMDPTQALQWVNTNVKPYFPATNIIGIDVGNEVFSGKDTTQISNLVPAMTSIHNALVQLGLASHIHVSSANSLAVLSESYPPSSGAFREDLAGVMKPFLQFLDDTGGPFWINAYPYFSYKNEPNRIPLDYALLNSNSGMVDPHTKLHYNNMLYAMVDAVAFAISKWGFKDMDVKVSETGWPSKGDPDETGATIENARIYNKNLLQRQVMNEGTPLRPHQSLEVYIFALFNEDMKPGATSERNFGLYQPDGTMAYNVGLTELSSSATETTAISLASDGSKAAKKDTGRMGFWFLLCLFTFKVLARWPV